MTTSRPPPLAAPLPASDLTDTVGPAASADSSRDVRTPSPTDGQPPAYASFVGDGSPRAQEKSPLLPPQAGARLGESTSLPHGGALRTQMLTAPLAGAARSIRQKFIEEPRLRELALAQAKVLLRQAGLAQDRGEYQTAVAAYEAAFATLNHRSVSTDLRFSLLLGWYGRHRQERSPFCDTLRYVNNAEVIECLCRIWDKLDQDENRGYDILDSIISFKESLRAQPDLVAWLEQHGNDVLGHITAGEDESATTKLEALQVGVGALEKHLGTRKSWKTVHGEASPKQTFHTSTLAEVLLTGAFPDGVDRLKNGLPRLVRLLQEKSCPKASAVLLRHDEDRTLTNLMLRQRVDEACEGLAG